MEQKKVTLTSANPEKYPDIDIICGVIDDMEKFTKEYVEYSKSIGEGPQKVRKTAQVSAREAKVGEVVDTRPRVERDGNIYYLGETKGVVKVPGSFIVTNPDGEEYIVKPDAFGKKYAPTDTPGIYKPIAEPAEVIKLHHDIIFKASWGEEMVGLKGGVLNISNKKDVYAIQKPAFDKTYSEEAPKKTESLSF